MFQKSAVKAGTNKKFLLSVSSIRHPLAAIYTFKKKSLSQYSQLTADNLIPFPATYLTITTIIGHTLENKLENKYISSFSSGLSGIL